jgi:uridine phosphorylase
MLVEWWTKQRGLTIQDLGVTPTVVVTWSPRTAQALAQSTHGKIPEHWMYGERFPLYRGELRGKSVSIAYLPIGAPGTVMMMDEMIACGAQTFIGLGWAGGLQEKTRIGTFVIPTSCISEEGTSRHYIDSKSPTGPSARLVRAVQETCEAEGVRVETGPVWTTDAPYRELVTKISAFNHQGVLAVDMETSAMYALGLARKIEVCNLLVVSDELVQEWKPAFRTAELEAATEEARKVVLKSLTRM